jgi:RimJ/RimL family protein N-acetyltransferase
VAVFAGRFPKEDNLSISASPERLGLVKALSRSDSRALARALGDTPYTVIAVHLLSRRLCRAYVSGSVANFHAALIQAMDDPDEPFAFGSDPDALWALLARVDGWTCVSVPEHLANGVAAAMTQATGRSIRLYEDLFFTMTAPVQPRPDRHVRYLTPADLPMWERSPAELHIRGFGTLRALLTDGVAAGAAIDRDLIAIAATSARTGRHADVGVATLEEFRGRGFATAAASLVVDAVRRAGLTAVWSTGEGNAASRRVAEKLGFSPAGKRTYVIPKA